jgi:integrase
MALTAIAVKNAKPGDKPLKLSDGEGMFLFVTPAGGKLWRLKYRFGGKEKLLSLGAYPEITLEKAREKRLEARRLLAESIDPGEQKKTEKAERLSRAESTFEVVARSWFKKKSVKWSPAYGERLLRRLDRDLFPLIGNRPIAEIKPTELLAALRKIEARGAIETAHRARSDAGQVFRFAVAEGKAERDIAADLSDALEPKIVKHLPAVTEPAKVAELLRALDGYNGSLIVECALKLAPLVFVRPGELRHAQWKDIDFDKAEWRYKVTKTNTDHLVPLSKQAVKILRVLEPITGTGGYVFPSARTGSRPMSDNAVLAAMRRSGIPADEMTGHGFRAMARTILDEVLGFRPDFIEHQLAHAVKDPNGRAYNRTAHLADRRKMMQAWADYLDKLKAGADVVPIHGSAA